MNYKIRHQFSDDRRKLILSIDQHTADELTLAAFEPEFSSDKFMFEVFEHLVSNSELQWIDPSETGDLTEAPMLGIRDEDGKVLERWAYMDYQIKDMVTELMNNLTVTFSA